MITFYVIQDTVTNKYLDFEGATDVKIWVDDIETAHEFTESDAILMLETLNTPSDPNRFVKIGRPKDRQPH